VSTEELHPLVREAARGRLPGWARVDPERRSHLERVAELLEAWARERGEDGAGVRRWAAAGWLHDALRDADPRTLRGRVEAAFAELPGPLLHGPAAARLLREAGVRDEPLLLAVAYHTLGHPELDDLGRATYCADFLDPGRSFRTEWRASLRDRMPGELDPVTLAVARARIGHQLDAALPLHAPTTGFWNRLVDDRPAPEGA